MKKMVDTGVWRVPEMQRHIDHFAETELFPDESAPPVATAGFIQTAKQFQLYLPVHQKKQVVKFAFIVL